MAGSKYEALNQGEKWGCGLAGLVGIPTLFILFGLAALGHCASECGWGNHPFFNVLLPFVAVTASVFFAVRWAINRRR
jgi:hypothetical protein